MIRFECPDCERPFKVADEHAGKSVRCPGCKSVIKVPAAEPEAEPAPPPRKPSRPAPPKEEEPRRRARLQEAEDDEPEAPRRRRDEDDDDRPRKKKRKKKADTTDSTIFMVLSLGLAILYVVLASLAFFSKGGAIVMLVIGVVPVAIGTWWVSAIAKHESYVHYLGCVYVPFYDTWFALTRWSETWAACLMCWIGRAFAATAIVFLVIHFASEKGGRGWPGPAAAATPAEIDAECAELLKSRDAAEARAWLAAPGRRIGAVKVGRLALRPAVEGLYQQGAVRVTFADMSNDEDGDDPMHLVVELPAEKEKRQAVVNFVNAQLLEPDDERQSDRGQKYLLVLTND